MVAEHIASTEEQITYLAHQVNAMQFDVAALQRTVQRPAQTCAEIMVQPVTHEHMTRMVLEAAEATATVTTSDNGCGRNIQKQRNERFPARTRAVQKEVNRTRRLRWSCKHISRRWTT